MDTSFQKTAGSDEWYTPPEIIEALGPFDLDPCSAESPLFPTASRCFTKRDDGLKQPWSGRVFLNPPYSQPLLDRFCRRMAEHGDGIVLVFARTGNRALQEILLPRADAVLFLRRRVRFYLPDGRRGGAAGADSCLVAFGRRNVEALRRSGIEGLLLERGRGLDPRQTKHAFLMNRINRLRAEANVLPPFARAAVLQALDNLAGGASRPSAEDRLAEVVTVITSVTGAPFDTETRRAPAVMARAVAASILAREGYTEKDIARALNRAHPSVHNLKEMVEDAISLPVCSPRLHELFYDVISQLYGPEES